MSPNLEGSLLGLQVELPMGFQLDRAGFCHSQLKELRALPLLSLDSKQASWGSGWLRRRLSGRVSASSPHHVRLLGFRVVCAPRALGTHSTVQPRFLSPSSLTGQTQEHLCSGCPAGSGGLTILFQQPRECPEPGGGSSGLVWTCTDLHTSCVSTQAPRHGALRA